MTNVSRGLQASGSFSNQPAVSATNPGFTPGSILIAHIGTAIPNISWPNPHGFLPLFSQAYTGNTTGIRTWIKVATGAEPATYTWTWGTNNYGNLNIVEYKDARLITPFGSPVYKNGNTNVATYDPVGIPILGGAHVCLGSLASALAFGDITGYTRRSAASGRAPFFDLLDPPPAAVPPADPLTAAKTHTIASVVNWLTASVFLAPAGTKAGWQLGIPW